MNADEKLTAADLSSVMDRLFATDSSASAIDERAERERHGRRKRAAFHIGEARDQTFNMRTSAHWRETAERMRRKRGLRSVAALVEALVYEASERGD